jgi:hypothetical protein
VVVLRRPGHDTGEPCREAVLPVACCATVGPWLLIRWKRARETAT